MDHRKKDYARSEIIKMTGRKRIKMIHRMKMIIKK